MSERRIYYSREAEMKAKREQTLAMILFLGLGVSIGGILALLFAPNSGEDTRQELSSAFEDRFEDSREATQQALHRMEGQVSDLRKRLDEMRG
jgi:gas vesicle protein